MVNLMQSSLDLIRPGSPATLDRLLRLGGRIERSGSDWTLIRLNHRRILLVEQMTQSCGILELTKSKQTVCDRDAA